MLRVGITFVRPLPDGVTKKCSHCERILPKRGLPQRPSARTMPAISRRGASTPLSPTCGRVSAGAGGCSARTATAGSNTVSEILSGAVIRANPFLTTMTAAGLIDRCAQDLTREPTFAVAQVGGGPEAVSGVTRTRSDHRSRALHHRHRRLALSGAGQARTNGKRSGAVKAQRHRTV
jgi:hypothetical protein